MRGEGGVAGEGRVVGVPKLHSQGKCTMRLRISTIQRFLWPVYYIALHYIIYEHNRTPRCSYEVSVADC